MPTTWTGYRYPHPEHLLLYLSSGVNYKPVHAYRFYHIVIADFDDKIAESSSLPYPYPNLYLSNNENSMPTDGENLMHVLPYVVLYMNPDNEFDPEEVAESLQCSYPQTYLYTWHVYQRRQAIIVNQIDLNVYRSCNGLPTLLIPPNSDPDYPYSITKSDIISDDLEYSQQHYTWKRKNEGEEVCTICLAEFEIDFRAIISRGHGIEVRVNYIFCPYGLSGLTVLVQ
ncbi:hypothetical protein Tco_1391258 [Tanacetum coccineum]